jgi:F-type H+-transporting ATPase subunit delta
MRERAELYADAFYAVLLAEGSASEIQDELFRFSQIIEGNDELRETLSDPHIPAARRQQIVEDLIGETAFPATTALVSLVVAAGRSRDLPAIVGHLLDKTASLTSSVIAEVRSAVDLSQDQKDRLAEAIKKATGQDVDIVVIVDPAVLGGIVTQIGDTVIDGSVRHRLAQLKESF